MTETDIKEIVRKQRSYFYTGTTLPVEKRLDALKKLKACIQKYEPLINEALKRDLGKSNFESYTRLPGCKPYRWETWRWCTSCSL